VEGKYLTVISKKQLSTCWLIIQKH